MGDYELEIDKKCAILRTIASNYDVSSEEYKALEMAADALLCIFVKGKRQEFITFLQNRNRPLTEREKKHLDFLMDL